MIKKVAAIHDLSGIGRCSLTVAIPILSALKIQCCPFPTAILSTQTAFSEYSFLDLTNEMPKFKRVWNNLNVNFDCIYSGFLGSKNQIDIISKFIDDNKNSLVVVDPVMGDDGKLYSIFDKEMCINIKNIVKKADLVTPNLTEALILIEEDLNNISLENENLINIAKKVSNLGPSKVVITGIKNKDKIYNLSFDKNLNEVYFTSSPFNNISYSGTGDIFTSIVVGMLLNNNSLKDSVIVANDFIKNAVAYTENFNTNKNEGIMFENFLNILTNLKL